MFSVTVLESDTRPQQALTSVVSRTEDPHEWDCEAPKRGGQANEEHLKAIMSLNCQNNRVWGAVLTFFAVEDGY